MRQFQNCMQKKYNFNPVLVILIQIILLTWNDQQSSSPEDFVLIEFQEGGEIGRYQPGDTYGFLIRIMNTGNSLLYELIISEANGEIRFEEKKLAEYKLDPGKTDSLYALITGAGFFDYPARLPDYPPREIEIREPSPSVRMQVFHTGADSVKTVAAQLGADNRYYPNSFLDIRHCMHQLIDKMQAGGK